MEPRPRSCRRKLRIHAGPWASGAGHRKIEAIVSELLQHPAYTANAKAAQDAAGVLLKKMAMVNQSKARWRDLMALTSESVSRAPARALQMYFLVPPPQKRTLIVSRP